MSQYPAILAGQRITASLLLNMLPLTAYKTANTDRSATTLFADDPDLLLPLAASAVYLVSMRIYFATPTGGGAPLFKTAWDVPAGWTGNRTCMGPGSAATDSGADNMAGHYGVHNPPTAVTYGGRNSSTNLAIALETAILTTTTAGNVALQWAQATSSASPVRVGAGSSITATRIG